MTLEDLLHAREAYSLGGGSVLPIVCINDAAIGDGKPGPVYKELDALLRQDMETFFLDEIPYKHYAVGGLVRRGVRALAQRWHRADGWTLFLLGVALPLSYALGKIRGGPTFVL